MFIAAPALRPPCPVSRHLHDLSVLCTSSLCRFHRDDYAVEVRLNDYLDIVCPHYPEGDVPQLDAERYVLYMVEREDYESCKPQSYDQMRWECGHPFAPHAPEKFSEKFQRFTPFTLGKEFRQGESYYYICECLPSSCCVTQHCWFTNHMTVNVSCQTISPMTSTAITLLIKHCRS